MATPGNVKAMFDAKPPQGANVVGGLARSVLVNKVKAVTPGVHTQAWPLPSHPPFREIFFPGYQPVRFEADVDTVTGLDDTWWADLSAAVLVEAIHNVSAVEHDHVNTDVLGSALAAANGTLAGRLTGWYGHVFTLAYQPFTDPYNATPDKATALGQYKAVLTGSDWIHLKILQYANGQWPDRDWELYHHWLKLSVLGAADTDIDALIRQVKAAGLPVPDVDDAGRWRSYLAWMAPLTLSGADVRGDAAPGILGCAASQWCFPEENAAEFMATDQPGERYWQPYGPPSCLSGSTLVRRPDGSATPIGDLRRGDEVSTPDGPRRVLLVSRSPRAGRPLYRVGATRLRSTAGHPWRTFDAGARHVAARPDLTRSQIPGLADDGIAAFGAGIRLLGWRDGRPVPVVVDGVTAVHDDDPWVYGIVPEPGTSGFGSIVVTDGTTDLVTAPELPPVERLPYATVAVLAALPPVLAAGREVFAGVPAEDLVETVRRALRAAHGAVPAAWRLAVRRKPADGQPAPDPATALAGIAAFGGPDGLIDWRSGALIDLVIERFGAELRDVVDAGWRRPPRPGGPATAVTVHRLHRHDGGGPAPTGLLLRRAGDRPVRIGLPPGMFSHAVHVPTVVPVEASGAVRLDVAVVAGDRVVAAGSAWTSWPAVGGYRRAPLRLRQLSGAAYGTVGLDLCAVAARPQPVDPDGWDDQARLRFAAALGVEFGRLLAGAIESRHRVGGRMFTIR